MIGCAVVRTRYLPREDTRTAHRAGEGQTHVCKEAEKCDLRSVSDVGAHNMKYETSGGVVCVWGLRVVCVGVDGPVLSQETVVENMHY